MDEPPVAEALFIEDGAVVAVGSQGEVLAAAADQVPVIDIGQNGAAATWRRARWAMSRS